MTLQTKNCPTCFIEFAAPKALFDKRYRDGGSWFCPNGHSIHFTTPEINTIREERDRLKQQIAQKDDDILAERRRGDSLRDQRDYEQRRVAAAKGQVTKLKKRAQHGVCPCCNRTFVDLQRHMATKHPAFEAEPQDADNVVRLAGTKS